MFEIKVPDRRSTEIFISHPLKPLHVMKLDNINELADLAAVINEYLAEKKMGEFIGSAQAQEIAQADGYEIPASTLVNACARDTIPGARKKRGRWVFPKVHFEEWYREWKAKQQEEKA